jgi:hypothetical protein
MKINSTAAPALILILDANGAAINHKSLAKSIPTGARGPSRSMNLGRCKNEMVAFLPSNIFFNDGLRLGLNGDQRGFCSF